MRTRFRLLTIGAVAAAGVFAVAGPALAHVEVSADKTTAGATDVTLTFSGEAENPGGGIQSERVVLPAGLAPAGVTLVKAPSGWKLTANSDGFTVGGKALKTGTDAVWKVKIAKLPDGVTRLSFKTLETYSNGDVSRWIEIQEPGQDEPDNPAPLVTLTAGTAAPATSAAAPPAGPSSAPAAGPGAAAPTTVTATGPVTSSSGTSTWWIRVVVVVLAVAAGVIFAVRRRRTGPGAATGN